VFHTSTGLRAVNWEAARRLYPLAKIGKLEVGHVVYRINEGSSPHNPIYDCQEIKSICVVDSGSQRIYKLTAACVPSFYANGYLIDSNDIEVSEPFSL
jgi:hypothetical protein